MNAIDAIQRRTSVRRFRPDPIPRDTIERLLECAVRAPNHKLSEPWRFAVLTGPARDAFAEIRARHRLKRYSDPASPEALGATYVNAMTEAGEVHGVAALALAQAEDVAGRERGWWRRHAEAIRPAASGRSTASSVTGCKSFAMSKLSL